MKQDQRKKQRLSEFMPVEVSITNAAGKVVAGPFDGRIVDICPGGAGLLMSQLQAGPWHVFNSLRDDSSLSLQLVVIHPDQEEKLMLSARPVWLNTFENQEFLERIMGVSFLPPDSNS